MLHLDGSHGEGGGQILRTSLALSVITKQAIRIEKIRAGRDKPGLRPQHLTGVQAISALSDAHTVGAQVSSREVEFTPQTWQGGEHSISIGTAGSTALLLHALYYPMAWHPEGGVLRLCGGTHNEKAPTYHYLEAVWAPMLRVCGMQIELEIPYYGFYPKGGGQIIARIPGHQRPVGIEWIERPPLERAWIVAIFAHPKGVHPKDTHPTSPTRSDIPLRMAQSAQRLLASLDVEASIECLEPLSASVGAVCHVFLQHGPLCAGFTAFGWKGRPAEQVGAEAAAQACRFLQSKSALDEWSADQVLLPLALAQADSTFTAQILSGHLQTNATIIERFLPERQITFQRDDHNRIHVQIRRR